MAGTEVVGRDEELGSIDAFLTDVEQGPTALVLAGEAGIGKTILWEAGVDEAARRCGRVLSCRGVEAEASLSFAALSELLAPVLAETLPLLAPPRRRALEVALLLVEPGEMVPDAHAIGLAVLDVLHVLAERGPVVVALDDVQWLDPSSAVVLQVALRRLRDEPMGLLATVREAPDVTVPIELERCFSEARLRRMSVGPLSLAALYHLLSDRIGLDLSRPELTRVLDATGANPFFALELGRELKRLGTRLQPGQPMPLPGGLAKLLGVRLARLSARTREVLLIAALAGRSTIDTIVAVHGEREEVLEAIDEAAREGVVVVEVGDGRVRFAHPLFASVLHEQAPPRQRRSVHRALAWTVADVEERARHLARAAEGADATVAGELALAAEHAGARGAPAAGAELCELAAELTPGDPALVRQRRLRAAGFHRLAGDGERAVAILDQLLAETPSGVERADVLFELGMTYKVDPRTMIELYGEALAEAGDDDARAVRILAFRTAAHMWATDGAAAMNDARAALQKAERIGDPVLIAVAIARTGTVEPYAAEYTPGLLERGAEIEQHLGLVLEYGESPSFALARMWIRLGEIERPRALLEDLHAKATARGDEGTRVMALWTLGLLEWMAGNWTTALDHATTARELVDQTQHAHARVYVGRVKAVVEADIGLVDLARASAEESLVFAQAASNEFFTILSLGSLGRVELVLGNVEAAAGYLRELPARLLAGGMNDPTIPVWADAIETLIAVGELDQAGAYLDRYEVNARRLGSPWAVAAAARCRGLLAAAEGDLDGALVRLERVLVDLDAVGYPLERGRTLLALGSVRRQAQLKGTARDALEQAEAIFSDLGARVWADKADREQRRISGRRPPDEQLTEAEYQVAALAARGHSNKEIAAELYLGVSTVEGHLSRVYRKLSVRRAELATILVLPRDQAANTVDGAPQT